MSNNWESERLYKPNWKIWKMTIITHLNRVQTIDTWSRLTFLISPYCIVSNYLSRSHNYLVYENCYLLLKIYRERKDIMIHLFMTHNHYAHIKEKQRNISYIATKLYTANPNEATNLLRPSRIRVSKFNTSSYTGLNYFLVVDDAALKNSLKVWSWIIVR